MRVSELRGDGSVASKTTTADTVDTAPSLWTSKMTGAGSVSHGGRDNQIEDSIQAPSHATEE